MALGAVAAVTTTLKLGTGICLVIERDPITLAKEVASLDHLSNGRVLFGIGGGWNAEEMARHGTPPRLRWKLLRERIKEMDIVITTALVPGRKAPTLVDKEMVESLGYRIRRLFVGVFVAGSALAGLGGVMWGLYQQGVVPQMGARVNVLIFIVIIIGGLGSVGGCFVGSILVALVANYVGFIEPKLALISNILVMALVLIWRPQGLFPVARR